MPTKMPTDAPRTGWPPGLPQDDSSALSRWFASRLDARYVLRKVCAEIEAESDHNKEPDFYILFDANTYPLPRLQEVGRMATGSWSGNEPVSGLRKPATHAQLARRVDAGAFTHAGLFGVGCNAAKGRHA